MLFELSIAKRYLIPKKKRLTMSLIALMSVGVISLVVWLVLVFLSVTAGLEQGWIRKLTALNAPIRITPTPCYYASYYYQVDSVSAASDYTPKNIGEKQRTLLTDPYQIDHDPALPAPCLNNRDLNPDGSLKDLVHCAFDALHTSSHSHAFTFQEYEISAAQLDLHIKQLSDREVQSERSSSQLCYLSSFSNHNPGMPSLLEPPRIEDLNHLLKLAALSPIEMCRMRLSSLFSAMTIKQVQTTSRDWRPLLTLLPADFSLEAFAQIKEGQPPTLLFLPQERGSSLPGHSATMTRGVLSRQQGQLTFTLPEGGSYPLTSKVTLRLMHPLSMEATLVPPKWETLTRLSDLLLDVTFTFQGKKQQGRVRWEELDIAHATTRTLFSTKPSLSPPWPYTVTSTSTKPIVYLPTSDQARTQAIVVPHRMQKSGLKLGDQGFFSYTTTTLSAQQEQRIPVTVAGFYDPGTMPTGLNSVLTAPALIRDINLATQREALIPYPTNGIHVWCQHLNKIDTICAQLRAAFDQAGILPYWSITPFYRYELTQDLFQQFKSDKYILTLIAALILIVACTNIISLLVILVGEKKREIAILRAMGTSTKSIALVFTLCGAMMGLMSTLIGATLAYFTLRHIDILVHFLSFLQGQEAFNALFYGNSLPTTLSFDALLFILIATPLISLLAGLIPALKACRSRPSETLRS